MWEGMGERIRISPSEPYQTSIVLDALVLLTIAIFVFAAFFLTSGPVKPFNTAFMRPHGTLSQSGLRLLPLQSWGTGWQAGNRYRCEKSKNYLPGNNDNGAQGQVLLHQWFGKGTGKDVKGSPLSQN